jgi:hypothetical protein
MAKRRRSPLADLCLCALIATAGAAGTVVAREYTENVYFQEGYGPPDWIWPWSLAAGGAAWALMAGLVVASRRPLPLPTLALTQLSFGVIAGLVVYFVRG